MASKSSLPEEDFTCPVCCDIYEDPVILSCSHSFCKACLKPLRKVSESLQCPVCRRHSPEGVSLPNLALKNVCEAFLLQRTFRMSDAFCSLHGERRLIFCLDDKESICVVCQVSKQHKQHDCCTIEEAVQDIKGDLKTALKHLKESLNLLNEMKTNFKIAVDHIKSQAKHTEQQIKEEFEMLYQLLQEEEVARVAALREEEEQKSWRMQKRIEEICICIDLLSNTIRDIERKMGTEDIVFLQNSEDTKKRAQCKQQVPEMDSEALIDVAKHLGNLQFRVWEKFLGFIECSSVILDPNTAGPSFVLSEDLTQMAVDDETRQVPSNPERFTQAPVVLGSEGFRSGRPWWDVIVQNNTRWVIGITKESDRRSAENSQEYGVNSIQFCNGDYIAWSSSTPTPLELREKPQQIRVQLDWDKGEVSFSDPVNNTHIYTFKHTLRETVFPFFYSLQPLKISSVKVAVTV